MYNINLIQISTLYRKGFIMNKKEWKRFRVFLGSRLNTMSVGEAAILLQQFRQV